MGPSKRLSGSSPPRIEAFFHRIDKPGTVGRRRIHRASPRRTLAVLEDDDDESTALVAPSQTVEYAVLTEAPERVRLFARAAARRKVHGDKDKENSIPPQFHGRAPSAPPSLVPLPLSAPASPDSLVDVWRRCSRKRLRPSTAPPAFTGPRSPQKTNETLLQSLVKLRRSLKEVTANADTKQPSPLTTPSINLLEQTAPIAPVAPIPTTTVPPKRMTPQPTSTPTLPAPSGALLASDSSASARAHGDPGPPQTGLGQSAVHGAPNCATHTVPHTAPHVAQPDSEEDFYGSAGDFLCSQDLLDLDIP